MTHDRIGSPRSDAEAATAAMEALRRDADARDNRIAVTVVDGWITLSGCAEHIVQRAMADCTVRYLPGVRGVTNLLRVARPGRRDACGDAPRRPRDIEPRTSADGALR